MRQALFELEPDPRPRSIRARFEDYDERHPEVWDLFVRFATEAHAAGRARYSARAIVHRIRWECSVQRHDGDAFRINDHFASHYARKLIDSDPVRFGSFFELRTINEESRA